MSNITTRKLLEHLLDSEPAQGISLLHQELDRKVMESLELRKVEVAKSIFEAHDPMDDNGWYAAYEMRGKEYADKHHGPRPDQRKQPAKEEKPKKTVQEGYRQETSDHETGKPNHVEYHVGDRVEIHPRYDMWMRGATHGTVHKTDSTHVHVKMDHPQVKKLFKFPKAEHHEHIQANYGGGNIHEGREENMEMARSAREHEHQKKFGSPEPEQGKVHYSTDNHGKVDGYHTYHGRIGGWKRHKTEAEARAVAGVAG